MLIRGLKYLLQRDSFRRNSKAQERDQSASTSVTARRGRKQITTKVAGDVKQPGHQSRTRCRKAQSGETSEKQKQVDDDSPVSRRGTIRRCLVSLKLTRSLSDKLQTSREGKISGSSDSVPPLPVKTSPSKTRRSRERRLALESASGSSVGDTTPGSISSVTESLTADFSASSYTGQNVAESITQQPVARQGQDLRPKQEIASKASPTRSSMEQRGRVRFSDAVYECPYTEAPSRPLLASMDLEGLSSPRLKKNGDAHMRRQTSLSSAPRCPSVTSLPELGLAYGETQPFVLNGSWWGADAWMQGELERQQRLQQRRAQPAYARSLATGLKRLSASNVRYGNSSPSSASRVVHRDNSGGDSIRAQREASTPTSSSRLSWQGHLGHCGRHDSPRHSPKLAPRSRPVTAPSPQRAKTSPPLNPSRISLDRGYAGARVASWHASRPASASNRSSMEARGGGWAQSQLQLGFMDPEGRFTPIKGNQLYAASNAQAQSTYRMPESPYMGATHAGRARMRTDGTPPFRPLSRSPLAHEQQQQQHEAVPFPTKEEEARKYAMLHASLNLEATRASDKMQSDESATSLSPTSTLSLNSSISGSSTSSRIQPQYGSG